MSPRHRATQDPHFQFSSPRNARCFLLAWELKSIRDAAGWQRPTVGYMNTDDYLCVAPQGSWHIWLLRTQIYCTGCSAKRSHCLSVATFPTPVQGQEIKTSIQSWPLRYRIRITWGTEDGHTRRSHPDDHDNEDNQLFLSSSGKNARRNPGRELGCPCLLPTSSTRSPAHG